MDACGLTQATRSRLIKLRTDTSWSGIPVLEEADRLECRDGYNNSTGKTFTDNLWQFQAGCILCVIINRAKKFDCALTNGNPEDWHLFFATIDRMLSEFDRRFSDNIDVLRAASVFNPSCEVFLDPKHISAISTHYSKAGITIGTLDSQLAMAKITVRLSTKLAQWHLCIPRHAVVVFWHVYRSSKACWHCFDTSCDNNCTSNERMLSTLGRVKKYLINSCDDQRLSDLLVLSSLSEDAKDLAVWDVVDNFARLKSRRYPLIHWTDAKCRLCNWLYFLYRM